MKWITCLLLSLVVTASRSSVINERLLNNIESDGSDDTSACTDYYKYACGKYGQRRTNDSFVGIFQVLSHKVNEKLLQLMEENGEKSLNESSVEAKVLRFYRNCVEAPPETRTVEHYLTLAPPAEGLTWPLLNPPGSTPWPEDEEEFKWIETLAHLYQYGFSNALIAINVTQNDQKNTEFLLKLGRPDSTAFLDHLEVQRALRAMRVPSERTQVLVRTLKRLDWNVKSLIARHSKESSGTMSVQDLNEETGYDWQRFIEIIVGHRIQPIFRVEVENIKYLLEIRQLMDKDDVELVANYIMAQFIEYLLSITESGEDPLECIKDVRRNMGVASNLLYKDRFLGDLPAQTEKVERVFEEIRKQMISRIERNRLDLTLAQEKMVSRKVKDLVLNIGHMPRFLEHWDFVNEYYRGLDIPPEELDYAREHLKMLKFRMQKELAYLRHPPTENLFLEWVDATISDPRLMARQNFIGVPYDLLQEPFFVLESDDEFQFSLMGFALARKLMSSLDDVNVKYDTHGNRSEIGIEIANSPLFQEALQCVQDKDINEKDINDRLADTGGLNLAYSAYLASSQVEVSALTKETFFRNLAQTFCTDGLPDANGQHENQLNLEYLLKDFAPFDRALECRRVDLQCQIW